MRGKPKPCFLSRFKTPIIITVFSLLWLEILVRFWPSTDRKHDLFRMDRNGAFQAQDWAKEWDREHSQLRRVFQAYEIYRLEKFVGKHINITEGGYRLTVNPIPSGKTPIRVGLFGGSTVWGGLVRDTYTIASALSKKLNELSPSTPIEVTNYGENGFVLSQDIHRAIRLGYSNSAFEFGPLDVMVFFSGVNDCLSALSNFVQGENKPAGLPWEFRKYRHLFKLGDTGEVAWSDFLWKLKSVRTLVTTFDLPLWKLRREKQLAREIGPEDYTRIAQEVAVMYFRLISLGKSALGGRGTSVVFVLQPTLALKNVLSPDEIPLLEKNEIWQPYLRNTYQAIENITRNENSFKNGSKLFSNDPDTLFFDSIHYSELGNTKIGEHLAQVLLPMIEKYRK